MRYFENIIFWISDFKLIELLAFLILTAVVIWSIILISCILAKAFSTLKKFWNEIKENELELKKMGSNKDKKDEKIENKKEQYEQAIKRILDSESLLIIGKYLTYIIIGFFILLVVAVIGLVLVAKL
jgi:hypothetical protein